MDTETTGLDPINNHLVSIDAVEVINCELTGIQYHAYIFPRHTKDNKCPNSNFLYYVEDYANERENNAKKSLMDFLRFVGNDTIITHNARFDISFINAALRKFDLKEIDLTKCICSLLIARKMKVVGLFDKNAEMTVKSLCKIYGVYVRDSDLHHGIVDAIILGRVVCKMWKDYENRYNNNENQYINYNMKRIKSAENDKLIL